MLQAMVPEQFGLFYRFLYHILKEPHPRKFILLDVAIGAWEMVMHGRFRLLDKWMEYIVQKRGTVHVINEDQWRQVRCSTCWGLDHIINLPLLLMSVFTLQTQVLDFSRTVHEDLSNFDANGAWACILDDFVDYLRTEHPSSR